MTLKLTIEEAIFKAAPDLDRLEVEGVTEPPRLPARTGTPVTFVPPRKKKDGATTSISSKDAGTRKSEWNTVDGLDSLSAGTLKAITVAGEALIFCQIAGAYYAYYNRCSNCLNALNQSRLDDAILSCASCGQQYDLYHAGKSTDASAYFLDPVPLLVEEGRVKVTLTHEKAALSALVG